MNNFLENLYFHVMEDDSRCAQASLQAAIRAEPVHRRLLELVGEEGETIWEAAIQVGCAEVTPAFWAGLRFGLRLLAVCLGE